MPDFTLFFTGVNAYVFPAEDSDEPLTVVMPNSTRLAASPQRDLPPHFPSKWSVPNWPEYTLWERLTIEALDASGVPIQGFSALPAVSGKGLTIDPGHLADAGKVSCVVTVSAGKADRFGPCGAVWDGGDGSLADDALIHTLRVRITASALRLTRTNVFDGSSQQETLPEAALVLGNVCAPDILGWPTNDDRTDLFDKDFEWIYEVTEPVTGSPLPKLTAGQCHLSEQEALDQALKQKVDAILSYSNGGGGGCGCECQGCAAVWK